MVPPTVAASLSPAVSGWLCRRRRRRQCQARQVRKFNLQY